MRARVPLLCDAVGSGYRQLGGPLSRRSCAVSSTIELVTLDEMLLDGDPNARPLLVLAHGAGAAMDSDWMQQIAAGFATRGVVVARFEFPYMRRRRVTGKRHWPDRPAVLLECWRQVVGLLGGGSRLVVGGKSMGGRIASMIADEVGAAGLVCFGYPFHPPGRPDKLRTDHLAGLRTTALILQGTRDPFGQPEEVATYDLADTIRIHWLEDGDHSLRPRLRSGRTMEDNLQEALEVATRLLFSLAGEG